MILKKRVKDCVVIVHQIIYFGNENAYDFVNE